MSSRQPIVSASPAQAAAIAASPSPQVQAPAQGTPGQVQSPVQANAQIQQQQQQQQQQQHQQLLNSSQSTSSQVVGMHYKIGKKIGEGSFGVLFEGTNMLNSLPVAIKFEPRKTEAPQLRDEYRTYKHLAGCEGIPKAYYFGQEGLHNILVIDLLGPSLEDLFEWCGRRFSVKSVVFVAVQMLTLIETVHSHDLIYRDIKPDNFLIGRPGLPDENKVHLIDFGMAKQYRDPRTKQHIPYREKKSLSGTARYMSVNTHLGREQSRRDDLEALGHVFFYFLRGQLPWQGLKAPTNKQKYEKIGEKKRTTPVYDLCSGLPRQFAQYLETVRNLGFDSDPDYEGYRRLLLSALDDINETVDGQYDWMKLNGGRGWDASINKKPNLHGYGHPNPPGERDRHHRHSQQRKSRQQQQAATSGGGVLSGNYNRPLPTLPNNQQRPPQNNSASQQQQQRRNQQYQQPAISQAQLLHSQTSQTNVANTNSPTRDPRIKQSYNQQEDADSRKSKGGFWSKILCCS